MHTLLPGKFAGISWMLAMVALITACTTLPPRTPAETEADNQLESAVMQALNNDPTIYARHIDVTAREGVVTLSGFVFQGSELFEAAQIAARVPGVTSVKNQIELEMIGRRNRGGGG